MLPSLNKVISFFIFLFIKLTDKRYGATWNVFSSIINSWFSLKAVHLTIIAEPTQILNKKPSSGKHLTSKAYLSKGCNPLFSFITMLTDVMILRQLDCTQECAFHSDWTWLLVDWVLILLIILVLNEDARLSRPTDDFRLQITTMVTQTATIMTGTTIHGTIDAASNSTEVAKQANYLRV